MSQSPEACDLTPTILLNEATDKRRVQLLPYSIPPVQHGKRRNAPTARSWPGYAYQIPSYPLLFRALLPKPLRKRRQMQAAGYLTQRNLTWENIGLAQLFATGSA